MGTSYGFCDLCVNADIVNRKKTLRELLQKLFELGYSTVAINQTVDEDVFETEKKNKKKAAENDSPSVTIPAPLDLGELVEEFEGKLRILSRMTFVFGDSTRTHTLSQSLNLRKHNLYAVVPKNQAAFQFACSQLNTDIICLNKISTGIKMSRKLYFQAVERGVHFEIQYSNVVDNDNRKLTVHNSHLFHMFGKSKNVIITSGASTPSQIRSPYDIVNLASILGLNETKAKASILSQSRYLILKSEGRRCGKGVFQIETTNISIKGKKKVDNEIAMEMEIEENENSDDCTVAKKIKL